MWAAVTQAANGLAPSQSVLDTLLGVEFVVNTQIKGKHDRLTRDLMARMLRCGAARLRPLTVAASAYAA